jgi:hypothetical protein|tara:strand:+ start:729 stop:896 length:168 start_codon:yes stop_codon:yes gene_type:complete
MVIKNVFKLINNIKKKPIKDKPSIINGVRAKSTLVGRAKVDKLKKIGKGKRETAN